MNYESAIHMEDVGTRLDHLTNLKDIWENALRILNNMNRTYQTPDEIEQKRKIETALEMLNFHMQKDYNELEYRKEINVLKRPT